MSLIIAAIATIFLFAAFIIFGALFGFIAGTLLVQLTITLLILGASSVIAAVLAYVFRIGGGAYGR